MIEAADPADIQRFITDEFLIALHRPPQGLARRMLNPLLRRPTGRFAGVLAGFDRRVAADGIVLAAQWLVTQFVDRTIVRGAEHVPQQGPLIVASNHPGAYDGFALIGSLCRDDIKVVVSDVAVLRALIAARPHLIFVPPEANRRIATLTAMARHLQDGGALLVFPSGLVDPDPELEPGAEQALDTWSGSLELMLRRAPATRVLPTIASGILARRALRNPIARLPRLPWQRRKLAEFLQLSVQLAFGKKSDQIPRITFGEPFLVADLQPEPGSRSLMPGIIERAKALLAVHQAAGPSVHFPGMSQMVR